MHPSPTQRLSSLCRIQGPLRTRTLLTAASAWWLVLAALPASLVAAAGELDCSFGSGGTVNLDFGTIEPIYDLALLPDGRFVTASARTESLRLARYFPSGVLDPSFGADGTGTVVHLFPGLKTPDAIDGVRPSLERDSLGRLVVAGRIVVGTDQEVFVARFNPDGELDPSFGGTGWVSFDFTAATANAGTEAGTALLIDSLDRPLVGGTPDGNGGIFIPSNSDLAVARLTTTGGLDPTFGVNGITLASSPGAADDVMRGMSFDSLGRIVAVAFVGIVPPRRTMAARWSADGALDPSFGSSGVVVHDLSGGNFDNIGFDVAVDSSDRAVLLAMTQVGGGQSIPTIARLQSDGSLDPTFGTGGVVHQSFFPGTQDVVSRILVQPDDKPLVIGWPFVTNFHIAVMRFTDVGALDPSWGGTGVVSTAVSFNERIYAAALQPDQRLLRAGGLNNDIDLVMARYLNDTDPPDVSTTTTILSSLPNPSVAGAPVEVSFEVTSGGPTPLGSVLISDGVEHCVADVATGSCSIVLSTVGARTIGASYLATGSFCTSSTTAAHQVKVGTTTTIVARDPAASVVGQPVDVAIEVNAIDHPDFPSGNVTISDGMGASCLATLVEGSGGCLLTPQLAGELTVTASYPGTPLFAESNGGAPHLVTAAATSTVIVETDPHPSLPGQSVSVAVTVEAEAPGGGVPSGTVEIDDGLGASCSLNLSSGAGSCLLELLDPGVRTITAAYKGNTNHLASDGELEHEVLDTPPQVLELAVANGPTIASCETLRLGVGALEVTFDQGVVGADLPASYRILSAGANANLETTSCELLEGDDLELSVLAASVDGPVNAPVATLQLTRALPDGPVRVLVCPAIEDAGGNALDGDGNGAGGDPFTLDFRVDRFNLFANGHFDRCPVDLAPWQLLVAPPSAVLASDEDGDDSGFSGSVRLLSASVVSLGVGQCAVLGSEVPYELRVRSRFDPVGGVVASLAYSCEHFDQPQCAGTSLGVVTDQLRFLDSSWQEDRVRLTSPAATTSAQCLLLAGAHDPEETNFDAYLDAISLVEALFADGFELGNTSRWSATVP